MAVKPLIGFGLGIVGAGFYWKLYSDAITDFFSKYIIDLNDKYYTLSDLVWEALPFIVIFLGIACLVFGSIGHSVDTSGGG